MKTLLLFLMFIASVSFAGNTGNAVSMAGPGTGCVDCWDYGEGAAHANGDPYEAYNYCIENLNACAITLEEVVIKA